MCGRYTLSAGHEALARAFLAEFAKELKASWKSRYNIAPGTGIVAVLDDRDTGPGVPRFSTGAWCRAGPGTRTSATG
jgi:putative SOS response-associated peptidase YedK